MVARRHRPPFPSDVTWTVGRRPHSENALLGEDRPRGFLGRLASLARNLGASLIGLLVLAVLLDVGLRLIHLSNDPRVLVYPRVANDINGFKDAAFGRTIHEGEFRILALGASAFVTREFQPEFERLMNEFPAFREREVRVVSAGVPAHMTYDSLWKYRYWYEGYDFDLVMTYHGINDARSNNYPESVFREDYAQFPYYRRYAPVFDWIGSHPWLSRSFAATFGAAVTKRAWVQLAPSFQRKAPYNHPDDDPWLAEGAQVKTAPVFERNLEGIIGLARERGHRVLLNTYAYYLPEGYTNQRFLDQETDYTFMPESIATEVWGWKENVVRAIEAHNQATRGLAARHPDALFFDMERHIPKDGAHFIDICHWTDRGRQAFADGILAALASDSETL